MSHASGGLEVDIIRRSDYLIFRVLPTLVQNTHLNVSLEGWPAATAIVAVCGTVVATLSMLRPTD